VPSITVLLRDLKDSEPVSLGGVIVVSGTIVEKALLGSTVTRPYSGSGRDYAIRPLLLARIYG